MNTALGREFKSWVCHRSFALAHKAPPRGVSPVAAACVACRRARAQYWARSARQSTSGSTPTTAIASHCMGDEAPEATSVSQSLSQSLSHSVRGHSAESIETRPLGCLPLIPTERGGCGLWHTSWAPWVGWDGRWQRWRFAPAVHMAGWSLVHHHLAHL